jgi:hypothetical protein
MQILRQSGSASDATVREKIFKYSSSAFEMSQAALRFAAHSPHFRSAFAGTGRVAAIIPTRGPA